MPDFFNLAKLDAELSTGTVLNVAGLSWGTVLVEAHRLVAFEGLEAVNARGDGEGGQVAKLAASPRGQLIVLDGQVAGRIGNVAQAKETFGGGIDLKGGKLAHATTRIDRVVLLDAHVLARNDGSQTNTTTTGQHVGRDRGQAMCWRRGVRVGMMAMRWRRHRVERPRWGHVGLVVRGLRMRMRMRMRMRVRMMVVSRRVAALDGDGLAIQDHGAVGQLQGAGHILRLDIHALGGVGSIAKVDEEIAADIAWLVTLNLHDSLASRGNGGDMGRAQRRVGVDRDGLARDRGLPSRAVDNVEGGGRVTHTGGVFR